MKQHSEQVVKSKEVVGRNVINPQHENLGKIEEIVLAKVSGEAKYVVLSLGMGDKLFALPWKSIGYDPDAKAFVLSVSKSKLEKAPGFDKDHWPDMQQSVWQESIAQYYGDCDVCENAQEEKAVF